MSIRAGLWCRWTCGREAGRGSSPEELAVGVTMTRFAAPAVHAKERYDTFADQKSGFGCP
jgi:hypothetical protein